MPDVLQNLITWYLEHVNYATVFIFMAIESSFIPLPSEIVIPPAAWKAASGGLNIYFVVLAGTLGSLAGALFNYFFALLLGRKIIHKLAGTRVARLMLIKEGSVAKAEKYFIKHGNSSTLIGRLVPGVRHLISIPAGLSKMKLTNFIMFTLIGSFIWTSILAVAGYYLYGQKELLDKYFKQISIILLIIGLFFILFLICKNFRKK